MTKIFTIKVLLFEKKSIFRPQSFSTVGVFKFLADFLYFLLGNDEFWFCQNLKFDSKSNQR